MFLTSGLERVYGFFCTQIIGIPTIGVQMDNDDLKSVTLELRMLLGMMHKVSRMAIHQRMNAQSVELGGLQVGILHILGHKAGQTLSELSRKFYVDPSTLVPTVHALERKGFVVRERDLDDRRRWRISLTEAGIALMEEIDMVDDDDPVLIAMQKMGAEQAQQFITLFRSLVGNLEEGEEILDSVCNRLDAHHARHINRGEPHVRHERGEWRHGGGRPHHVDDNAKHTRRGRRWQQRHTKE